MVWVLGDSFNDEDKRLQALASAANGHFDGFSDTRQSTRTAVFDFSKKDNAKAFTGILRTAGVKGVSSPKPFGFGGAKVSVKVTETNKSPLTRVINIAKDGGYGTLPASKQSIKGRARLTQRSLDGR